MAKVILLIGPPGAGKGTQAKFICERLDCPHISLGDIFRAEVAAESELGLKIKAIMESGAYVSDDTAIEVIQGRLNQADCTQGYLMDGFPRTVAQAEAFEKILTERGDSLQVLQLNVPEDQLLARITERAAKDAGKGARADDKEDVLKKRLEMYFGETAPLIEYYSAKNLLQIVDGVGGIPEVSGRVGKALSLV